MKSCLFTFLTLCTILVAEAQPRREPGPPPPVDLWMERLSQRDPEEYQRLADLRANDPEAFREAIRERLERQRQRAINRRGGDAAPPPFLRRDQHGDLLAPFRSPPDSDRQARQNHHAALRALVDQFHATEDAGEKAAIRSQLEQELGAWTDARIEAQEKRLEQALIAVQELQNDLEQRRANRDQWIQQRVDDALTRGL